LVVLALTMVAIFALPLVGLVVGARLYDVAAAMTDTDVLQAIGLSLTCAVIAIGSTIVLSVSLGHAIARRRLPAAALWSAFVELLVVVPHPLVGLGLLLLFARNRLLGAALSNHFGIDVENAMPGICLAMTIVAAPSLVKTSRDAFRRTPVVMLKVAESLGARPWRQFFTIELPLAWPGIRSGAILAWARAVSEFGAIGVLAYYPRTAPVLIWDRFTTYGLTSAIAPSLVLLTIGIVALALVHWAEVRYPAYEELER
jgi:molybdate/tungstate transport system permease protein